MSIGCNPSHSEYGRRAKGRLMSFIWYILFSEHCTVFFHFVSFLILKVEAAFTEIEKDTPLLFSVVSDHFS